MRPEYLDRLRSTSGRERMFAWKDLSLEPEAAHYVLSPENRRQLAELLRQEDDVAVHRMAADILAGYSCAHDAGQVDAQVRPPTVQDDRSLDFWVWDVFHGASALFRASEPAYARRDPDAVESLARRLGYKDFPDLRIYPVPKGEDSWQEIVTDQGLDACVFVGRLGLFGKHAVDKLVAPQMRFRFVQYLPRTTYPAEDDLKYYVIQEFEGHKLAHEHRTSDSDERRTDYGIVQRYQVFLGTRYITVLLCAGLSSLGTVGAARWVSRDLGVSPDPKRNALIMQPDVVKPSSRMEALVRTISVPSSPIWRPAKIELVSLYVDDYQWSPDDLQWHDNKQHVVEVRMRGGRPVSLWVDGKHAVLKPDSQNFRLATCVALLISKSADGRVDVNLLARNKDIWGGHSLETKIVKQRLHNLVRRVFGGLLTVGDQVQLNARVDVVEE